MRTSGPDPFRLVPRAVYITKTMLEKHGCASYGKRRAIQRGQSQTTAGHTTDCRKRKEELLGNDMVYRHRVQQANEIVKHYLGPRSWRLPTRSGSSTLQRRHSMNRSLTQTTQTRTWPMLILKVLAKARPPQIQSNH